MNPPKNYRHVGCPECGIVFTVPLFQNEPMPYCFHSTNNYSWQPSHPDTQPKWTQMVPVKVEALDG